MLEDTRFYFSVAKNPPCIKNGVPCPIRHLACHGTCKEYKDWRAEIDRVKANRQKILESEITTFHKHKGGRNYDV